MEVKVEIEVEEEVATKRVLFGPHLRQHPEMDMTLLPLRSNHSIGTTS